MKLTEFDPISFGRGERGDANSISVKVKQWHLLNMVYSVCVYEVGFGVRQLAACSGLQM